jgi:hypothetical protein
VALVERECLGDRVYRRVDEAHVFGWEAEDVEEFGASR